MTRAMVLDQSDNVATLIAAGAEAEQCELIGARTGSVGLCAGIPFGHKVALVSLKRGDLVKKYGQVIGRATADIDAGEHVHVHNLEPLRGRGDIAGNTER